VILLVLLTIESEVENILWSIVACIHIRTNFHENLSIDSNADRERRKHMDKLLQNLVFVNTERTLQPAIKRLETLLP
jgi:hypothetical protein